MGAHICFDRHIHIANKTWSKGVLRHLGYEDIDEQTLNEIVNNKKLKWIQISDYLPNEAYRKIDQILSERPDITFRLFHFLNNDEVDISFLMDMPHVKKVQIDCIEFKNNPKRINLSVLAELNLKSLHIECFDLRDYEFIQNRDDKILYYLYYPLYALGKWTQKVFFVKQPRDKYIEMAIKTAMELEKYENKHIQ